MFLLEGICACVHPLPRNIANHKWCAASAMSQVQSIRHLQSSIWWDLTNKAADCAMCNLQLCIHHQEQVPTFCVPLPTFPTRNLNHHLQSDRQISNKPMMTCALSVAWLLHMGLLCLQKHQHPWHEFLLFCNLAMPSSDFEMINLSFVSFVMTKTCHFPNQFSASCNSGVHSPFTHKIF